MVPLSFDSQRTSNNSDCPFISKQQQHTVQIFAGDREYLGSCSCSGSSTLKLPNLFSKYWNNTWNVSENLNEFLPLDTKWTEQLARTGCNLLDSNCQPKYQCSGGSLQSSHQKNMRFDCIRKQMWCSLNIETVAHFLHTQISLLPTLSWHLGGKIPRTDVLIKIRRLHAALYMNSCMYTLRYPCNKTNLVYMCS